jgi:ABC-type multidrug transport system fused ATPase/permease subunit
VVFVAGALALTRTVGGVRTYAIGGNPTASRFAGINVDRHHLLLFVYLGVSVGLVAMLATARLGSGSPTIGADFEIDVLTAVILGGVAFDGGAGRPVGVFIGVVTISILNSGMIFIGLENFYQQIAKGLVLLLALGADQALASRHRRASTGARAATRRTQSAPSEQSSRLGAGDRPPGEVVLAAEHLRKAYGSVVAVSDVSVEARAGEVLCLVGDNGAGKSTVIKMLSGVLIPDAGTLRLDGKAVRFGGAGEARAAGIETVYQDLALCANLGAAYNLVLGQEPRRWGRLPLGSLAPFDRTRAIQEADRRLRELDADVDDFLRPVEVRRAASGRRHRARGS